MNECEFEIKCLELKILFDVRVLLLQAVVPQLYE